MTATKTTMSKARERFPELTLPSTSIFNDLADLAFRLHNKSQDAVDYLTAHLVCLQQETVGNIDGGSNEVSSDGLGPLRRNYMSMASSNREVFCTRSPYGRMFLILESRLPSKVMSVKIY